MKIDHIALETPRVQDSKKPEKNNSGTDFQKLLEEANGRLNDASQGAFPSSLNQPLGTRTESTLSPPPVSGLEGGEGLFQIRSQGVQSTVNALEILEDYQQALADPAVPLKRIDQLVQSLSREIPRLNVLSEKLPPSDPLQKILAEVGILSTVEIEKFRRGEYV